MELWYKKLGYYENPFLINPLKESSAMLGQEKQLKDALYYIKSGSLVFVQGPAGGGKTKFLQTIIKSFRGRIIYVNVAKLKKNLDIERLLRKRAGAFKKTPRDMILLLDNVNELSLVNLERIKYFYDQGYIQSIVFTGNSMGRVKFPESMKSRIGKRLIKLDDLSPTHAVLLALHRLDEPIDEDEPLISKNLLKKVFDKSKKNPKNYLINLHRVFEEMHFDESETVKEKHLSVLNESLDAEDQREIAQALGIEVITKEEQFTDRKGNKIMKVGDYYRAPAYDVFCGNCGAIVKRTDRFCVECDSEFENPEEVEDDE